MNSLIQERINFIYTALAAGFVSGVVYNLSFINKTTCQKTKVLATGTVCGEFLKFSLFIGCEGIHLVEGVYCLTVELNGVKVTIDIIVAKEVTGFVPSCVEDYAEPGYAEPGYFECH